MDDFSHIVSDHQGNYKLDMLYDFVINDIDIEGQCQLQHNRGRNEDNEMKQFDDEGIEFLYRRDLL